MEIITRYQDNQRLTAVALGYFDGMHPGHVAVVNAALDTARRTRALPTLLTFDMTARRPSGKGLQDIDTPAQKQQRAQALGIEVYVSLDFADVAPLTGPDFVRHVLADGLKAVYVCCGADFRFGKDRACGVGDLRDLCARQGIEVVVVPAVCDEGEPISTTRIKQALLAGDMPTARRLLGHAYGFTLPVYEDKHLARRLGFPTINQRYPQNILVPRNGVYYTTVSLDGVRHGGVSNLGDRPTVEDDGAIVLETHILDFSGDLYGCDVPVEFVRFMRDERRFADVEAMRACVERDIETAREIFGKH